MTTRTKNVSVWPFMIPELERTELLNSVEFIFQFEVFELIVYIYGQVDDRGFRYLLIDYFYKKEQYIDYRFDKQRES